MPKVVYQLLDGDELLVDVPAGTSVMMGALQSGVSGIEAECGGCLSCATCHVYLDQTWYDRLDAPGDMELSMLDAVSAERRPTSRLSCQIEMSEALDGLVVYVPASQ